MSGERGRAAFERVAVVSRNRRFLSRLEEALEDVVSEEERESVALLSSEEIPSFLSAEPAVERVAGYKVKVRYKKAEGSEEELRAKALCRALAQSLKRIKGGVKVDKKGRPKCPTRSSVDESGTASVYPYDSAAIC